MLFLWLSYAFLHYRCSALVLIGCSNETFGGSTALSNAMIETMYTLVPDSSLWTIIPQLYSHIPRAVFDETILRSGECVICVTCHLFRVVRGE